MANIPVQQADPLDTDAPEPWTLDSPVVSQDESMGCFPSESVETSEASEPVEKIVTSKKRLSKKRSTVSRAATEEVTPVLARKSKRQEERTKQDLARRIEEKKEKERASVLAVSQLASK